MSRTALIAMAKSNLAHAQAGTIDQEPEIARIPVSHYYDKARFRREIDRVWKRMPLILATTAELPKPGDYKATEAVGVPVIIVRGHDGRVRAFVNSCRHRGAVVATEPRGNARHPGPARPGGGRPLRSRLYIPFRWTAGHRFPDG